MKREKEETGVKTWEGALENISFDDITQVCQVSPGLNQTHGQQLPEC